MGSLRDSIVDWAHKLSGGYGVFEYAPTHEDMNEYFLEAWGQTYDQAGSHTRSHWCGIWAVYVLRKAGLVARWGPVPTGWGVSSTQVKVHNGNQGVQPGDVGYVRNIGDKVADHHFLITGVAEEYDYLECIDGNAGGYGCGFGTIRRIGTRTISDLDCYYEILE